MMWLLYLSKASISTHRSLSYWIWNAVEFSKYIELLASMWKDEHLRKLKSNCRVTDQAATLFMASCSDETVTVIKISVQRAVMFQVVSKQYKGYRFAKDRFNIIDIQYKQKWPYHGALRTPRRIIVANYIYIWQYC